jgi:hypothetical protein
LVFSVDAGVIFLPLKSANQGVSEDQLIGSEMFTPRFLPAVKLFLISYIEFHDQHTERAAFNSGFPGAEDGRI